MSDKPTTEPLEDLRDRAEQTADQSDGGVKATSPMPDTKKRLEQQRADFKQFQSEVQERIKRGSRRTSGRIV